MVHIEVCNRKWFDAGSDASDKEYSLRNMYSARQRLMAAINAIGEKGSLSDLESALSAVPSSVPTFDGALYISGANLMVSTPALPMDCYIGKVVD